MSHELPTTDSAVTVRIDGKVYRAYVESVHIGDDEDGDTAQVYIGMNHETREHESNFGDSETVKVSDIVEQWDVGTGGDLSHDDIIAIGDFVKAAYGDKQLSELYWLGKPWKYRAESFCAGGLDKVASGELLNA